MYVGEFTCKEDVLKEFSHGWGCNASDEELKDKFEDIEILFASYEVPDYEGYAFVLFIQDGKLYEVNGSHCSCYGLEGQWEPEETSLEALMHRTEKGNLSYAFHCDANTLGEYFLVWAHALSKARNK